MPRDADSKQDLCAEVQGLSGSWRPGEPRRWAGHLGELVAIPRDLDGNLGNGPEAFYDAALNITWLRNTNVNLGPNTTGQVDWPQALAWSSSLVVSGVSGWRLPTMVDTGAPGCGFNAVGGSDCGYNAATATSELAHLFYVSLGNAARCVPGVAICTPPSSAWGVGNSGAFLNLARGAYTTGLEYAPLTTQRWMLDTDDGFQFIRPKNSLTDAMVVRDGAIGTPMPFTFPDPVVVPVPQPQSYAMMIIGLGALGAMVRRNKQRSALGAASEAQRSSSA